MLIEPGANREASGKGLPLPAGNVIATFVTNNGGFVASILGKVALDAFYGNTVQVERGSFSSGGSVGSCGGGGGVVGSDVSRDGVLDIAVMIQSGGIHALLVATSLGEEGVSNATNARAGWGIIVIEVGDGVVLPPLASLTLMRESINARRYKD